MDRYHFLTTDGDFGAISVVPDDSAYIFVASDREIEVVTGSVAGRHSSSPPEGHDPILWPYLHYLWMRRHRVDESTMVKPLSEVGAYHPRMWRGQSRPLDPFRAYRPIDPRRIGAGVYVDSIVAARSLFDSFDALCRSIQPSKVNFTTYGHRCRELLLLVCTEVEAAWRGVLVTNNGVAPQARISTKHYVHLLKPLGLADWAVSLRDYPEVGEVRPFHEWSADAPTKSLRWYDDYNAVKHDRELNFSRATFGSALFALAALHVLLAAQWGPEIFSSWFEAERSPFVNEQVPVWSPAEMYSPPHPGTTCDKWVAKPYFSAPVS